jgi:reductive dehalogenase
MSGGVMPDSEEKKTFNRRQFLKVSGAASAVLGSAGLGFYGYEAGRDPSTYTGWKTFEGGDQTFNRKRFAVDRPHYDKVGPTSRADGRTEVIFARGSYLHRQWNDDSGLAGLEPFLRAYYEEHTEDLELDLYRMKEIIPRQREDQRKYGHRYFIAEAWSNAMGAVTPVPITEPPEISDFPRRRDGISIEPVKLKSPEKTSKLIQKIAHELGSTLVGIAKLNPDWVFQYPMWEWRGFKRDEPIDVPKHWEYAVVVGTPMSWDPLFANPSYGTSNDAYSISRIIAFRLASFIKQLGYAARPHTPGTSYDLMVPPICVDAGLGEQGRHSIVITPELGCNFRPAVVTTNLPLKPDKPIEFGVQEFCRTCKICAEQCPSGAITTGGKEDIRGYRRYQVHPSKCLNFWNSTLGSMGCRLCVAVCPYSRKANWVHKTALNVTTHDPTGISHAALTQLQKVFYPGQDPQTYYIPSLGGENASYRKPPWWLRTEDFIEF